MQESAGESSIRNLEEASTHPVSNTRDKLQTPNIESKLHIKTKKIHNIEPAHSGPKIHVKKSFRLVKRKDRGIAPSPEQADPVHSDSFRSIKTTASIFSKSRLTCTVSCHTWSEIDLDSSDSTNSLK